VSVTRFKATAAPTPVPVAPAVAFALESLAEVAVKVALAPPRSSADTESSCAVVFTSMLLSASEPATDTDPAAPEIASLPKPDAACVSASRSRPPAVPVAADDAWLATFASVIATPAPIAAEPPVAEPSAFDFAVGVSEDVSVSVPPIATVVPIGSVAFADAFEIVTATAAATATPPLEVDADGVALEPEPDPPFAPAVLSAWLRSPATWPSTPPAGDELDVPLADAVALPFADEEPVARKLAALATTSARLVVADASWFATVTATAAPTAAEDPEAEPDALVSADAVCSASTRSAPPMLAGVPTPSDASVTTFDSATATDGTIATPPPAAPVCDVVVIASVLVA
jgi:hypothetical protein